MQPGAAGLRIGFVDVVPDVEDDVQVLLGDLPVGRVVALLVVLAGDVRDGHFGDVAALAGSGAGVPDGAALTGHFERVVVVAARQQAVNLDMYTV